jgi:hypothetical protein
LVAQACKVALEQQSILEWHISVGTILLGFHHSFNTLGQMFLGMPSVEMHLFSLGEMLSLWRDLQNLHKNVKKIKDELKNMEKTEAYRDLDTTQQVSVLNIYAPSEL